MSSRRSTSLADQLRQEARQEALDRFGPGATAEQIERVYGCEWSMFTYHFATGGDLDCTCGAHARLLDRGDGPVYRPEDFG